MTKCNTLEYIDFNKSYSQQQLEEYLFAAIKFFFPNESINKIEMSLSIAKEAHKGQLRADGQPYIVHPIRVALLLLKHQNNIDKYIISAAILHDALEDSDISFNELSKKVGEKIANLTLKVTRYRPKNESSAERKTGKLNKWKIIMESPIEIRLIKTFDYLDNVISWKFIPKEYKGYSKISRWLMEAESMYLPLADKTNHNALGIMLKEIEYYKNIGHKTGNWYSDGF